MQTDMIIPTLLLCKSYLIHQTVLWTRTRCRPASERWGRRCTWGGRGQLRRTPSSGPASWLHAPISGVGRFSAAQSEWWSDGVGQRQSTGVGDEIKYCKAGQKTESLASDISSQLSHLLLSSCHTHTRTHRWGSRGLVPMWFTMVEVVNPLFHYRGLSAPSAFYLYSAGPLRVHTTNK